MPTRPDTRPLEARLAPFLDAGLLTRVPTSWQHLQGQIEMMPFVLSSDATAERHYVGAPFGHPLLRQPIIVAHVGLDHFRTGSALGSKLSSVCTHLQFTYHEGMPVFDLQVIQTHENGLAELRRGLEDLLENRTAAARRRNRWLARVLPDVATYHRQFLGEHGWIARAEAFDYPAADSEGSELPSEFWSLVTFLDHCATHFPASRAEQSWWTIPGHLAHLGGRRMREGKGQGWFAIDRSKP